MVLKLTAMHPLYFPGEGHKKGGNLNTDYKCCQHYHILVGVPNGSSFPRTLAEVRNGTAPDVFLQWIACRLYSYRI